jgi:hypothetical protein
MELRHVKRIKEGCLWLKGGWGVQHWTEVSLLL